MIYVFLDKETDEVCDSGDYDTEEEAVSICINLIMGFNINKEDLEDFF